MSDLTKEQVALNELRGRIAGITDDKKMFDDDLFLLQWLKSQNLKVDKTEDSIRESIKWREENNVSTLVREDTPKGLAQELPIIIDGASKDGLPVILLTIGGLNFREIIDKYGKEAIYSYWTQVYAKVERLMIDYNKSNAKERESEGQKGRITWNSSTGVTVIVNIKNFSLRQAQSLEVVQVILNGAKIIMKYFPAIVSCVYFINMNTFFSLLFKLLSPILSSPSMKLEQFGCDENKWRSALLKFVPEDQLTPEFGGNKAMPTYD